MDTRNEGKPSPTDEWGDEPLVEVMRKKHRIEGARLALEAARASAIARAKQFPHRRLSHAEIAAWLTKLLPDDIVREAEAKDVDR